MRHICLSFTKLKVMIYVALLYVAVEVSIDNQDIGTTKELNIAVAKTDLFKTTISILSSSGYNGTLDST